MVRCYWGLASLSEDIEVCDCRALDRPCWESLARTREEDCPKSAERTVAVQTTWSLTYRLQARGAAQQLCPSPFQWHSCSGDFSARAEPSCS